MSTATFVKSDSTTEGTWYNGSTTVYGADGYGIANPYGRSNDPQWPAYATVTITGGTVFGWAQNTSSAKALEQTPVGTSTGTDTKRDATAWYNSSSFTIDISDGGNHQIAIYFLDGDASGRSQTITITDDNNGGAQLDQRTVSSFQSGIWLVWDVSGKVTFTISLNSGTNAVVSGIFFDPAPATPAVFPPFVSRPRFEPAHYE